MTVHLVLGGDCPDNFQLENYQEQDLLVGVDHGALRLLKSGYPLDVAIGDFDSVQTEELRFIRKKAKEFYQFPSEKDDTDAELAIEWLMTHYNRIPGKVYCWTGGRIDHLLSLIYLIYQPRFKTYIPKIEWITPENRAKFYLPGEYEIKRDHTYQYFSIISLTPIKQLIIRDARYRLQATDYSYPRALISNEFLKETFYFSFISGIVLLLRTKDSESSNKIR